MQGYADAIKDFNGFVEGADVSSKFVDATNKIEKGSSSNATYEQKREAFLASLGVAYGTASLIATTRGKVVFDEVAVLGKAKVPVLGGVLSITNMVDNAGKVFEPALNGGTVKQSDALGFFSDVTAVAGLLVPVAAAVLGVAVSPIIVPALAAAL